MNGELLEKSDLFDRIQAFVGASVNGEVTASQLAEAEQLLRESREARDLYVELVELSVFLPRALAGADDSSNVVESNSRGPTARGEAPSPLAPPVPSLPVFNVFGNTWRDTAGSLLSHDLFIGYVVATVLFGVAALITSHIYLPQHRGTEAGYANNHPISPVPMPVKHDLGPEVVSIARITGMVDCQWENTDYAPIHDRVVLGTKYMLKSGLMKITYYTGAKVILQGPCTYTAESADGGYLSLGKLTARVESRSRLPSGTLPTDRDTTKSRPAGGAYFAVHTPTATVTDLGTEFGVEVVQSGRVDVVVLEGVVETVGNKSKTPRRMTAGQAVRYVSDNAEPKMLSSQDQQLALDVRQMSQRFNRRTAILRPVGLVASGYHRVWDARGVLKASDDRQMAFRVATDGIFGRGERGEGPRSSFDTFVEGRHKTQSIEAGQNIKQQNSTAFVGLLYGRRVRIDSIKVFFGRQSDDGGSWQSMPRVFIQTKPVDSDVPPENDPAHWRELSPAKSPCGLAFNSKAGKNPGEVFEMVLANDPEQKRVGYGWAIGGVNANGAKQYLSITELRGYGVEAAAEE